MSAATGAARQTETAGGGSGATALHREVVVIDMCAFYFRGYTSEVERGGATALNVTVPDTSADFAEAVAAVEAHSRLIARDPERLAPVRHAGDIVDAKAAGRVGVIFGFQNAAPIGRDLGRLETLWRLGLRVLQLTYNERNLYADGCLEPEDGGLSRLGRDLIREVNRLGVVLDLSHVGRRSSLEAIEASSAPPIISHANPYRLAPNPRNITDEQARAVASTGGVVGVCGWGPICWRGGDTPPGVADFVDHIDYYVDLVGIDHVGFGTDSPAGGLGTVAAHAAQINALYPEVTKAFVDRFGSGLQIRYPVAVWGLTAVTAELSRRGYRREDVGKVMGGNFLRVFQAVWR